jgi:hypothetical protein
MFRQKVDVMMIRTSQCGDDPRVEKFIFHYQSFGIKVGITCFTRGKNCSREFSPNVIHTTHRSISFSTLESLSKIPRRFVLYSEFILNCIRLFGQWNPIVIHGCDLDGYTLARISNGLIRKKKIFEVYDPWTTMTQSKRAAKMERKAFYKCDVLVMPANDSRIKIPRNQATFLGNEVDIQLAEFREQKSTKILSLYSKYFKKPYILVGGTITESIGISSLISVMNFFPEINVLIATDQEKLGKIYSESLPSNVILIGVKDWGTWLAFVKRASFVWVYYDATNLHYASHISPNKYWEASLYGRPMFVYQKEQFCDRVPFEGLMIELGANISYSLPMFLKGFLQEDARPEWEQKQSHRGDWLTVQAKRRENVKEILEWVGLL